MNTYIGLVAGWFIAEPTLASIKWDYTSKDIEVHPLQLSVETEFPFSNTGSEPIEILEVTSACGCLSWVSGRRQYDPGESGIIRVRFNLNKRVGLQRTGMSVRTSDNPTQPAMLSMRTNIPFTYKPSAKRVIWNKDEARNPKKIRFINSHKEPFVLERVVLKGNSVEVTLIPIREGYEYELVISPVPRAIRSLVPIIVHPEIPEGLSAARTFTVYAIFK